MVELKSYVIGWMGRTGGVVRRVVKAESLKEARQMAKRLCALNEGQEPWAKAW